MSEHIFISYSRQRDRAFTEKLYDGLKVAGFSVWLDTRDIAPGEDWVQSIDNAIRNCWCFIFIMTPVSIASSDCSDEWSQALKFKRPILPLMVETATIPERLKGLQSLDFTGEFDKALQLLSKHLIWIRSPAGELQTLHYRLDYLRSLPEYQLQAERVQVEINTLQAQVAYKEQALRKPRRLLHEYHDATRIGIDIDKERFDTERKVDRAMARNRVIGTAPQGESKSFKDRTQESAKITNVLLSEEGAIRVVSIYGRGGIGKTALACEVMAALEKDIVNVRGLIYLSSRSGLGINLERIYLSSARMLGGMLEQELNKAWINPNIEVGAKIRVLLEHYEEKRYIILLDNLEDLLDTSGTLTDAELQLFFEAFMHQRHNARLLITSREPINFAIDVRHYERRFPLEQGLPVEDAINLLKEYDYDGSLGLSDADPGILHSLIEKIHGYPRALEAIIGLLFQDPFLSLGALLRDENLFATEIVENLIREAQSRLDNDSRRVMQALAVYNRPVTEAAVRFLLEPFVQGLDIEATLRRLARGLYITVKRNTGEIALHPLDREYSYRQIPIQEIDNYSRHFLERRAAEYYSHLRIPSDLWKSIADLEPQLLEFDHRIKAEDYDTATRLLNEIDFEGLTLWGHARRVIAMRQQLIGKIAERKLEGTNLSHLGYTYYTIGQFEQAIHYEEQGLAIAKETQDKQEEGFTQGNLGRIYHNLGMYEHAIEHYMVAVKITHEIGDKRGECAHLANMGIAFANLEQQERTIELCQQAVEIARELQDRRGEGRALGGLAIAHVKSGQFEQATHYYQQAITCARDINDKRGQSIQLGELGDAYRDMGQYEQGMYFMEQGLAIAREMGSRGIEGDLLASLAKTYVSRRQYDEALDHLLPALKIALEIQNLRAKQEREALLAQIYLAMNRLLEALDALLSPNLQQSITQSTLLPITVYGLILMRLEQRDDARIVMQKALKFTNEILIKSPRAWSTAYIRGLILCGLTLLAEQDRNVFLVQALEAYNSARATCSARGIVEDAKRLLEELLKLDRDGVLDAVQKVMSSL
jgi:tetratricopeptide (TPR) repeat protein